MNPRLRSVLPFVLLLLFPLPSRCQWVQAINDTLVDVFPLSIGNQWTYRYFTLFEMWPSGICRNEEDVAHEIARLSLRSIP